MIPLLHHGKRAASEAIFGSAARGDSDAKSDRDILLVDDDVALLRVRARELERLNWSVASYTFRKLRHLADRGALFIQHLKLEATITCDENGELQKVLTDFRPLGDYSDAIADNAQLARLAGTVPDTPRGILLAADVLYVSVRNFGVLSLAERGVYCFSYAAILQALEAQGLFCSGGASALMELRSLKGLYRAGESLCASDARLAVVQALAALPTAYFPEQLNLVQPRAILAMPGPDPNKSAYLHLRDLERRLIAIKSLNLATSLDPRLTKLARWVSAPRSYAITSKKLAPAIRRYLEILGDCDSAVGASRSIALR